LASWVFKYGAELATRSLDAVYIARAAVEIGKGPHLDVNKVLALDGRATKQDVLACVLPGHEMWRAQAHGGSRRSQEPARRLSGTLSADQHNSVVLRLDVGLGTTTGSIASRLRTPGWAPVTTDWLRAVVAAIPRTGETAELHAHFSALINACDSA
jgi:hypothetical protein